MRRGERAVPVGNWEIGRPARIPLECPPILRNSSVAHLPFVTPCPFLPTVERRITSDDIHNLGADRGEQFYTTALAYAQSLWLDGFPAMLHIRLQVQRRSVETAPPPEGGGSSEVDSEIGVSLNEVVQGTPGLRSSTISSMKHS